MTQTPPPTDSSKSEIGKRQKAESNLAQSEEIFRLLVAAVNDYAIFALDPKGNVLTWNAGAHRLKGYEAHEIIGTHFSRFYLPEDAAKPAIELKIAEAEGRYEEEGWRVRKDGSLFWANVTITPLRDEDGHLRGFAKVTRDLSTKREAEETLKKAYEDLEHRVLMRTAELEAAKNDAEKALSARDDFFSIASHELRTPLTSLKLKADQAKRRIKPDEAKGPEILKLEKFVTDTADQVDRLAKLVEDMLDLTRISQGKLPLDLERVNLKDVVHTAVDRIAIQFRERGTPFGVVHSEDVFVIADRVRIEQVVLNLFTNALRYAPGATVGVEILRRSGRAQVIVKDEGPGIPAENHEQIFKRYERLESSHSIAGLGIGLYLCRSIIETHHGTIKVESTPGKGANFIIDLPEASS